MTHPTFYGTTSLQWYRGASCAPPFISSEPPRRTEPLPDPPHGVTGSPDPAPDRVGPSQPPLNFVDGNGYIVLRGLVEARDCEVGWNKVMKAWGSGDEKVVAKNAPGGGSNLPAGQELVGMFAYRLVSGHWRVQTGVSRIGEAGTVTTAGICGLNVLTGWEQRRPEWVDVA